MDEFLIPELERLVDTWFG